jgi:hypothetical protein
MGMFDYIRCDYPLPDGWKPSELQTKDFNCEMVMHVITAGGRLMLERIDETHIVPKEERPHPNEDGLLGMMGMLRHQKSSHESDFHGVVNFYGSEYRHLDGRPARPRGISHGPDGVKDYTSGEELKHVWHEYNAKFTDGKLVSIEVVDEKP